MSGNTSVTDRLHSFMHGDSAAAEDLLREVLPKLREIALRALNRERFVTPLSRTELINELWVSSLSKGGWKIRDQGHFYALASMAMRRVLIDFARKRLAARRGSGDATYSLDECANLAGSTMQEAERVAAIGILMDRLETKDPEAARIVDMHYFTGFTLEEISKETGLTPKQVRSRWERGLKWLKRMLQAKA